VEIVYSQYVPLKIPQQVEMYFGMMMQKAAQIEDPYEQSFFLAAHIPYLQPFADCNKRTSRVACNIPLLNKGVLPVSWREVTLRDYHDALLCLYERQSMYGLAQVYTEACIRSFERFDIEQRQRRPNRLEVTYAKEIEDIVRRRVLDGDYEYCPSMPQEDWNYVSGYVDSVLKDALENDMVLAPYRIAHDDWHAWKSRDMASASDAVR